MAKINKKSNLPRGLERAGALCLAFANTAAPRRDDRRKDSTAPPPTRLATYADLVTWAQRMGLLGAADGEQLISTAAKRPEDAAAVLARALELRAALVQAFTTLALKKEPRPKDLATLNGALRARHVVPSADGFRRDWGGDATALDRLLWPVAHSAAELLSSEKHRKIRQCATRGCRRLFVYANSRRLWCDDRTCGSRSRGRRYHEHLRQARNRRSGMTPNQLIDELKQRTERRKARVAEKKETLAAFEQRMAERQAEADAKPLKP